MRVPLSLAIGVLCAAVHLFLLCTDPVVMASPERFYYENPRTLLQGALYEPLCDFEFQKNKQSPFYQKNPHSLYTPSLDKFLKALNTRTEEKDNYLMMRRVQSCNSCSVVPGYPFELTDPLGQELYLRALVYEKCFGDLRFSRWTVEHFVNDIKLLCVDAAVRSPSFSKSRHLFYDSWKKEGLWSSIGQLPQLFFQRRSTP